MGITTDPESPCLKNIEPSGMQSCYLVLSEEERAKGFIRPVRTSYRHVGIAGPKNPLRDLTEDEHKQYDQYKYIKYEEYPDNDGCVVGRYWTQEQLDKVGKGCGTVTTMGMALAETYARNIHFYGATWCCGCGKHLKVGSDGEFVWEPDGSRVGS